MLVHYGAVTSHISFAMFKLSFCYGRLVFVALTSLMNAIVVEANECHCTNSMCNVQQIIQHLNMNDK